LLAAAINSDWAICAFKAFDLWLGFGKDAATGSVTSFELLEDCAALCNLLRASRHVELNPFQAPSFRLFGHLGNAMPSHVALPHDKQQRQFQCNLRKPAASKLRQTTIVAFGVATARTVALTTAREGLLEAVKLGDTPPDHIQVTDSEENEVAIVPLMDVVQARKK
jgi:hypothetical protein